MVLRNTLNRFRRHRVGSLAAGAALALLVLLLLSVTARADESHGDEAHDVTMSCPGTVNEGETLVATLTRGSDATKPIKGSVVTEAFFAQIEDYVQGVRTVDHNGDSTEVRIGTTQDTKIEGDESFRLKWVNEHIGADTASCQILILDDDDVDVESVEVTSTPESGDTYGLGETIKVTLTLDKDVDAVASAFVFLELDATDLTGSTDVFKYIRQARYESGSGTDTIVYAYTVQRYDLDTNGLSIRERESTLGLPGLTYAGTSTDVSIGGYARQSNLSAHKVDGLPRITGFEITSEPDDGDAYRIGEQIVFEMTLDAKVKVVGAPALEFTLGTVVGDRPTHLDAGIQVVAASDGRWAAYDADRTRDANDSNEGPTVVFVYDVRPTDNDSDGVAVPENLTDARTKFVIPGRTVDVRFEVRYNVSKWAHVRYQAHYDHDGLEADSDHAVDGTDPLIEIDFGTVNNALGATLTFWNIPNDDGDMSWRADVTSSGNDQDSCEGANMGADNTVAEDDIPGLGTSLTRTVNLTTGCPAGSYTMEVTASVDGEEVASASTEFQVNLSWSPSD